MTQVDNNTVNWKRLKVPFRLDSDDGIINVFIISLSRNPTYPFEPNQGVFDEKQEY